MAAEVMLVGVAKVALEEGVKFLYEQAGKVLDAWRARRRNDPAAPPPVIVPAPAQVTVGAPQPSSETPDPDTILTLEDLRADAEPIANGALSADDPPPGRRSPPCARSSRRPSARRSRSPARPPARSA